MPLTSQQTGWLSSLMPYAQRESARTGISADVILAQASLETGYGAHVIGNNLFGIKGNDIAAPTTEYVNGRLVQTTQSFKGFASISDAFKGYGDFILGKRYSDARSQSDPTSQLASIVKAGYGGKGNPTYLDRALGVMKNNTNALAGNVAGSGRAFLDKYLGNTGDKIADVLAGAGSGMSNAADALNPFGAVESWVQRGAIAIIAIILLGAAIFAMTKTNPVTAAARLAA